MGFRSTAVVVALLVLALTYSAPALAARDRSAPVLESISLDEAGPFGPGSTVSISYETTDASALDSVRFDFRDDYGHYRTGTDEDLDGTVEISIGQHWPGGVLHLRSVHLDDSQDNYAIYTDDGEVWGSDIEGSSHDLDFDAASPAIENDAPDLTAPVLEMVGSDAAGVYEVGDSFTFTYTATDDYDIRTVGVGFESDQGAFRYVDDADPDGVLPVAIDKRWSSGAYKLSYVVLEDGTGNYSAFDVSGERWSSEGSAGTHTIDFSSVFFDVDNPSADVTPPILNSVSIVDEALYSESGDEVTLDLVISDESAIEEIEVGLSSSESGDGWFQSTYRWIQDTDGDGRVTIKIKDGWGEGDSELWDVSITDEAGNSSTYYRNGEVHRWPGGEGTHSVDLAAGDFTVLGFEESFDDALDRGSIDIDMEAGYFLLNLPGIDPVLGHGSLNEIGVGTWSLGYASGDLSLISTFQPGAFFEGIGHTEGSAYQLLSGP